MTETLAIAEPFPDIAPLPSLGTPKPNNNHPRKSQALSQVFAIQARLMDDLNDPDTTPAARAQLARAWDVLEDRKRILRGKGLPQQVPPKASKPTKQPRSSFTESAGTIVASVPVVTKPETPQA